MKRKPTNRLSEFSKEQLRSWDDSDGVNFAIALARITGWLLHVDWWSPTDDQEDVNNMKSLRVYVGDHLNSIFELRGKQSVATFSNNIVLPLAKKRGENKGIVLTRFYSEQDIFKLPLRVRPNEERIKQAEQIIKNNKEFLSKIPKRASPAVPAHIAANFSFGYCAIFASAMSDVSKQPASAIIALEYNKLFGHSKLGYAHSIIPQGNNLGLDIWGTDEIKNIADRFGIVRYTLDENEHRKVIQRLKINSPDKYEKLYNEAVQIVKKYFI